MARDELHGRKLRAGAFTMSKAVKAAHEYAEALREQFEAANEHVEALLRYADTNRFTAREGRKLAKGPVKKNARKFSEAALKKAEALGEFAEVLRENNRALGERIEATHEYAETLRECIEIVGIKERDMRDLVKMQRKDIGTTRKTTLSIRKEAERQDKISRAERGYAEQLPELVRNNPEALLVLARDFRKGTRGLNELSGETRETADEMRGEASRLRASADKIREYAKRFASGAPAGSFDAGGIVGAAPEGPSAETFDASELVGAARENAGAYIEMSKMAHEHLESLLRYVEADRLASDAARKIADALPEKEVREFANALLHRSEMLEKYVEASRATYEAMRERSKAMHECADVLGEYKAVPSKSMRAVLMRASAMGGRVSADTTREEIKQKDEATKELRKYAEMLREVAGKAPGKKLDKEERKRYRTDAKNAHRFSRDLKRHTRDMSRAAWILNKETGTLRKHVKSWSDDAKAGK